MRLSRYVLPVTRETPACGRTASPKLMLQAGLVVHFEGAESA